MILTFYYLYICVLLLYEFILIINFLNFVVIIILIFDYYL